jgi:hypothetical protein
MTGITNNDASPVPPVGEVFSVVLLMSTVAVLAACVSTFDLSVLGVCRD